MSDLRASGISILSASGSASGVSLLNLRPQLSKWNSRSISALATFPVVRETNALAGSYFVNGLAHVLDNFDAPASGRVEEYGERCGPTYPHDVEEGMYRALKYPTIVEGWVSQDGIRQFPIPNIDSFVGFELGSLNANPPFSNTPSGGGCIQVRFSIYHNDVVLYTCRGDGVRPCARLPLGLSSGIAAEQNIGHRVLLEWEPGEYARFSMWDANADQLLTVTQDDPDSLPLNPWLSNSNGFALINCTGTVGAANQMGFSHFWIHTYNTGWLSS